MRDEAEENKLETAADQMMSLFIDALKHLPQEERLERWDAFNRTADEVIARRTKGQERSQTATSSLKSLD